LKKIAHEEIGRQTDATEVFEFGVAGDVVHIAHLMYRVSAHAVLYRASFSDRLLCWFLSRTISSCACCLVLNPIALLEISDNLFQRLCWWSVAHKPHIQRSTTHHLERLSDGIVNPTIIVSESATA
jgi:hypothetical protein